MSGNPVVHVDRSLCQGTGYCEQVAAGVFRVGPDGVAEAIGEVTDEMLDQVREAEDICPTRAIRLGHVNQAL